jgi:polyribonucleotide 5'-hydroxyl-kinase
MGGDWKVFKLEPEEELRVEVDSGKADRVVVELLSGHAEIFGTEMVVHNKYQFARGAKFAVFTFQGCRVQVQGSMEVEPYTSKETPMLMYLNTHAALEQLRQKAEKEGTRGPICMLVGPTDVGKSTVCRLLLNYAVRLGRKPIHVDLDVGQGSIAVPGSVGAVMVERAANVEEGFCQNSPIVYHYGHNSPGANHVLFNQLVSRLADVVRERLVASRKAEVSGVVINTCGWIKGEGYNQIKHIAKAFEVDAIIVLDHERVYNDLVKDMPKFVKVVMQPKSGGVVSRNGEQRGESRDSRVKQYFYGPHNNLFPHRCVLQTLNTNSLLSSVSR